MNKPWVSTAFCALSGVVLVAGVVASISSLSRYSAAKQQFARAVTSSERLDDLEQGFAALDALTIPFEGLRYDNLIDPVALINTSFGTDHVVDVRRDVKACDEGYSVNRVEVSLSGVDLVNVLPFGRMAESLRPPLRLTGCTIHASSTEAGIGDVILKLERIERPGE